MTAKEYGIRHANCKIEENKFDYLIEFASHLNSYEGMEDIRFDFMVTDFINGRYKNNTK